MQCSVEKCRANFESNFRLISENKSTNMLLVGRVVKVKRLVDLEFCSRWTRSYGFKLWIEVTDKD